MEKRSGISDGEFFRCLDEMYDEIMICDRQFNLCYVSGACSRHYGLPPEQMVGKNFYELSSAPWWTDSVLPQVMREKRTCVKRQKTFLGTVLTTVGTPILDEKGEVAFLVLNVRDDLGLPQPQGVPAWGPVVGCSSALGEICRTLEDLGNGPCLFLGEPGVGKTLLCRYLAFLSPGRNQTFGCVDCRELAPEDQVFRLFGNAETLGLLDRIRSGTLVLRNISALTPEARERLLDLFGNLRAHSRVRILATSQQDLRSLSWDPDLCRILGATEISVPPLRDRREDIRPLLQYYLSRYCREYGLERRFTEGALEALEAGPWPGNVEQLRRLVQRLVLTGEEVLDTAALPPEAVCRRSEDYTDRMETFEASILRDAYEKYHSSRKLAEHLGISQTKANNLIRKYIRE